MSDNPKERAALDAFDAAVESARLLGAADAKRWIGDFTDEDARFVVAMHQSIAKHRAAIEAIRAAVPAETDVQWQKRHPIRTEGAWENTYEHDAKWWRDRSKGWEIRMLAAAPQPVAQPGECEWTNCPRRVGDVCCNDQAKPEQAAQPTQASCQQTTKKELPMLPISDEQAEAIASEVYARNPVDGVDAAFKLDWELVRAGISHAKALNTDDSCPHGNAHIVHDCLRCGAPVCCGKCCADDVANEPDAAGEIAYQLTKKLVIDMPTARAAVDAAIAALQVAQPLTPAQRRALIDEAGDKTDGLNQDDFADEIVLAVERHHGIAASPNPKD